MGTDASITKVIITMNTVINSVVTPADIRKAASEGWTPSQVLGALRLVIEREAQRLHDIQDSLETEIYNTFKDMAHALMLSMPYGIDDEEVSVSVSAEEWELLCDWYNAAMDRYTIYVSDRQIADVLHVEVSATLTKVADVIRKEWELFGLDKI